MNVRKVSSAWVALLIFGCGASPANQNADAGSDAGMNDAGSSGADFWQLGSGASSTPLNVYCMNTGGANPAYQVAGSAIDRTSFEFRFQAAPSDGTYTIEAATTATKPAAATGVVVNYGKQVTGGADERHYGQSGSVTVTTVGGKTRASVSMAPSKEATSSATNTVSAQITCK